jgi:hypothetical protein
MLPNLKRSRSKALAHIWNAFSLNLGQLVWSVYKSRSAINLPSFYHALSYFIYPTEAIKLPAATAFFGNELSLNLGYHRVGRDDSHFACAVQGVGLANRLRHANLLRAQVTMSALTGVQTLELDFDRPMILDQR